MTIRRGKRLNLDTRIFDIQDGDPNSQYFNVTDFNNVLTGGKNSISLGGSELLKSGTPIEIEVLDLNKNPLYTEIGRSKGNVNFRDGVSTVVAIHVTGEVPIGNGKIYIAGTTVDGKSVRWSSNITIQPSKFNETKIRFYNTPALEVKSLLLDATTLTATDREILDGTIKSVAVNPKDKFNFTEYDTLRKPIEYQIHKTSGDSFKSQAAGELITLKNIILSGETTPLSNVTHSSFIKEVVNSSQILIDTPFIYPTGNKSNRPVRSIQSADYEIEYTPIISNPFFVSSNDTTKISVARITLRNLETFTGNVHRLKLYRTSFNSNVDKQQIADTTLEAKEVILDEQTPDRQREHIGGFYDQLQIDRYWNTSSVLMSLTYDSSNIIDGMKITNNVVNNTNKTAFVIAKDDSVYPTSSNSIYSSATTSELENRSGSGWDSNFMPLLKNVEYEFSANIFDERVGNSLETSSKIEFYLTSSQFNFDVSKQYDGYGVKIGEVTFKKNESRFKQTLNTSFTLNKDVNCTIVIVPYYPGEFTVSNISIKPFQQFGFSPSTTTIRMPFDISVANERFIIESELFDVNFNNVPLTLSDDESFDRFGESFTISGSIEWNSIVNVPDIVFQSEVNSLTVLSSSHAVTALSATTADTASHVEFGGLFNESNLLKLGDYFIWVSDTGGGSGSLRIKKDNPPTSDGDGFSVC